MQCTHNVTCGTFT